MTAPFQDLGSRMTKGWIVTNDKMETNIPGIYAIGDVRQKDIASDHDRSWRWWYRRSRSFNYIESHK